MQQLSQFLEMIKLEGPEPAAAWPGQSQLQAGLEELEISPWSTGQSQPEGKPEPKILWQKGAELVSLQLQVDW